MLRAVERRFGDALPASPVEWLTDNGSVYRAHETRAFAREIGLEPRTTAVRSPQSNGIAESFVKTMKRDYIEMMPKPDSRTAVGNLAIAFEHYNEHHPHSAFGVSFPSGISAQSGITTLSGKECLDLWGQIHRRNHTFRAGSLNGLMMRFSNYRDGLLWHSLRVLADGRAGVEIKRETMEWMMSDDIHPFSFVVCCAQAAMTHLVLGRRRVYPKPPCAG